MRSAPAGHRLPEPQRRRQWQPAPLCRLPARRLEPAADLACDSLLHGSGERGSEAWTRRKSACRNPFGASGAVAVRCGHAAVPFSHHHWTDPDMMAMAMAALDAEVKEFRGDHDRVYLTGLSLADTGPGRSRKRTRTDSPPSCRCAVVSLVVPAGSLARGEYSAGRIRTRRGRTPTWIFHGADDPVVNLASRCSCIRR